MKRLVILLVLIMGAVMLIFPEDKTIADKRIEKQVELQYSEQLKNFYKPIKWLDKYRDFMNEYSSERYGEIESVFYGATVKEIQKAFETGNLTIREYTAYCLYKTFMSEKEGMHIMLEVNPELEEALTSLETAGEAGKEMPLYGIPVVLKGNIGTGSYMETTAGAAALEGGYLEEDPFIVKKIRDAGGIIMGKANLSEWANYMTNNSANGFSALGGQTVNPYGRFDVGGSSSGSAAAVAYGIVPLAVGTETSGSIIYPVSQNSVAGHKPTTGSVSRDGIIPLSEAQDTAGPMALNVEDAALLFEVMSGYDKGDPATGIMKSSEKKQFAADADYLKGLTVAIVMNEAVETYLYRSGDKDLLRDVKKGLKRAGARVVTVEMEESIYEEIDVTRVFQRQFRLGVDAMLKGWLKGTKAETLADIIIFNEEAPAERMPQGQSILIRALGDDASGDLVEHLAEVNSSAARSAIGDMLERSGADILVTLSNYMSYIYAAGGCPAVNVPAGYRESGEPAGVTFIAGPMEDIMLLKAAYAFEHAVNIRRKP